MTLSDKERKERKKEINKKYNASPKGKATRKRGNPKNKVRMRTYNKKPEIIEKRKKYNASPKRKAKMHKLLRNSQWNQDCLHLTH